MAFSGAVRMKWIFPILLAFATPTLADGDPNILRAPNFEHSSIYHIEGMAIPVLCDCAKEVADAFFIEVAAPFDAPRLSMMAGIDMATRMCAARGSFLAAETANLSVVFTVDEFAPMRWIIAGDCG